MTTADEPASSEKKIHQLRKQVLSKRPILREVLTKCGQKNLMSYAHDYVSVYLNPPIQKRQDEFITTFTSEVAQRLGQAVAQSAAQQLRKYYFVSTADHHGPVTSPFFLNSNLMIAVAYAEQQDPLLKNIIILSCANVSLNNSSFPRGLLFSSKKNGHVVTQRLSFLPSNAHSCTVHHFRSYTSAEIKKIKQILQDKVKKKDVTTEVAAKLNTLIDTIYNREELLQCSNYSDQVIKSNFLLWQQYFTSSQIQPTQLIYLEQESLVIRLLLEHHLYQDTIINRILFDHNYDFLIKQYFEGIMGAFSHQDKIGTYLFWGVYKENNYRVQLWKFDHQLVSENGVFKIELTPDALCAALEQKQIIPNMMLIFIVLCFYYGLKCLGGFNQINYLTFMKNAYIKMCADRGNYRSIEVCARAQTKEMNDGLTIAFLQDPVGESIPATGLDLILYGNQNTWSNIVQTAKQLTLEEALNPLLPELYRVVYPVTERDPQLTTITNKTIAALTGLNNHITPCVTIS